MAEQPRFGFPALNRVSHDQSVFMSASLWIFFLWDFAAVLLYQPLKYSVLHIALLYILAKGMAFKLNLFPTSEDSPATANSKPPKYFLDINLFCDIQ